MGGDICAVCCATSREETVECPLDCEHLRNAHRHEAPPPIDPSIIPHRDVRLDDETLRKYEYLAMVFSASIVEAAEEFPGANDLDAREALEALVQTQRASLSGVVAEMRPSNGIAARMYDGTLERLNQLREYAREKETDISAYEDVILQLMVFTQRLEYSYNTGRTKSKGFLGFLNRQFNAKVRIKTTEEIAPGTDASELVL